MKAGKKQVYILMLEISILVCSLLCFSLNALSNQFVAYSRMGLITLILDLVLFCIAQNKLITVQTLFIVLFVLFQFGLPVVYAFNANHYNFYMTLFDESILVSAAKYTILAIQLYILVATFIIATGNSRKESHVGKWEKTIVKHAQEIENAALLLFAVTALVAVPVNLWSAVRALTAGIAIGNSFRGAMAGNALTRFFQEFFYSSGLLYLCFSTKPMRKKIVSSLYLTVALSMVVVADRSGGVTAIIVYALYRYYSSNEKKKNALLLVLTGGLLAILSSAIAITRTGESSGDGVNLLFGALEEMGFNFTSLCFVMDYIPSRTNYRFGMSYLVAIVLLIPKSLGLGSIYPKLQSYLGETWLWNTNNLYGRDFLSFGVGFSMIAESYYNFSWFGILAMIPISVIITHFLKEKKIDNQWSLYIRLVLMLSLFTAPRRQFQSVIKALEYSVFFTALYLLVCISIKKRKGVSKQ